MGPQASSVYTGTMTSSRRKFIQRGLLGSALLFVGGTGALALYPANDSRAPRRRLLALDATTFAIMAAFAERIIPAKGSADAIEVAHRVDVALCYLPVEACNDVTNALRLLENGLVGLFMRKTPKPFTYMDEKSRDAAIKSWETSEHELLRSAFGALRKLCLAGYYATLQAGSELGYPGPRFMKAEPDPIKANGPLSPPYVPKRT